MHDIEKNKYDVEIVDEEVKPEFHLVKVKTVVDGEEHVKQFNFSHDQTPGGQLESWKKHIRQWIDRLEKNTDKKSLKDGGVRRENVGK